MAPSDQRPRPQTARPEVRFKMPGYTGHVKGVYDCIGTTPAHSQYKAQVRGFSEMDPNSKAFVPKPNRDVCNDPQTTFKRRHYTDQLWPSQSASRPASAPVQRRSNKSHIVMGDDRFFQSRSHYTDNHASSVTATGAMGIMDASIFSTSGETVATSLGARVPKRLSDLSTAERKARYARLCVRIGEQAVARLEANMRLRMSAKASNDNVNGKRMMRMFTAFDEDSSGFIDFEEFHKGLLSYGIQLESEQCLRLFCKYDPEAKGYLDYVDFMREIVEPQYFHLAFRSSGKAMETRMKACEEYASSRSEQRMLSLRQAILSVIPNDKKAVIEIFHTLDTDNSGCINIEEFSGMLSKLHFNLLPAEQELLFGQMDVNGDGDVSYQEFLGLLFPEDMQTFSRVGR